MGISVIIIAVFHILMPASLKLVAYLHMYVYIVYILPSAFWTQKVVQ